MCVCVCVCVCACLRERIKNVKTHFHVVNKIYYMWFFYDYKITTRGPYMVALGESHSFLFKFGFTAGFIGL